MHYDPLLTSIIGPSIEDEDDTEEDEFEQNIYIKNHEDEECDNTRETLNTEYCGDLCTYFIDASVISKFIKYVCKREKKYYLNSFCDKYFQYFKISHYPEDFITMNKVDAWNIDWAYGLMFQAFVAFEYDLEMPCLKKRNRKIPLLSTKMTTSIKSKWNYDKDPIYEELITKCHLMESDTYKRKSPREQILLHVFIIDMLLHPYYRFCIVWHNKNDFTFEIINSKVVAHIWMTIKGNDTCNYENFARGIRFKRQKSDMFSRMKNPNRRIYQLTNSAFNDYRSKRKQSELANELLEEACL